MKMNLVPKAIVLVFFVINMNSLNAQIVRGIWSIGPDISYSSSKTEIDAFDITIKATDLRLGMGVGYYLMDNLEVAMVMGMVSSTSDIGDFNSKSSGFNLGPQLHYKVPISGHFYLPIGGGLRYNSVSSEDDGTDQTTFTGMSYYLFTGIEYIENNKLGAFLGIGPEFGKFSDPDSDDEFDLNNFGVGLGFDFYF